MTVYVVTGPPAAGKTTWTMSHARPGDIVIDMDRIAVALTGTLDDDHRYPDHLRTVARAARTAAITAARHAPSGVDTYIVHTDPSEASLTAYRSDGARIVVVDPGRDVVMDRCRRTRPRHAAAIADRWYTQSHDRVITTSRSW